jgi:putative membrane protein
MMGFGGLGVMGGLGMVMGVLIWVLLLILVIWGVSTVFRPQRGTKEETPLEILRRRYAAGEISEAELEQARRALG